MPTHRLWPVAILLAGTALLWSRSASHGLAADASGVPEIVDVRIGFDGVRKVGYWTPVWMTVTGGAEGVRGRLEVTTSDGDGVPVTYEPEDAGAIVVPAHQARKVLRYVKLGRTHDELRARLVDEGRTLASRSVARSQLPPPLLATQQLVLSLGRPIGVTETVHRFRRRLGTVAVCPVEDLEELPRHWYGYQAVDVAVVTTSEPSILEQADPVQFAAFEQWVRLGGRLILCVGRRGEQVFGASNPLARFAPGTQARVVSQRNTTGLENFAGATEPLDAVGGSRVRRFSVTMTAMAGVRGDVVCRELGGPLGRVPVVVRFPYGLGQIVFVAVDLDQSPFDQWQGRPGLVGKILYGQRRRRRDESDSDARLGQGARRGYDDLVGQLRAALDQFQGVTRARFSWVAGLIVGYILLIGPADYFLLRKLGRSQWTWLTLSLVVGGFCALAYALGGQFSGNRLHVNQVDLVDVDVASATVRGTTWTHVYSPATQAFQFELVPKAPAPQRADARAGQLFAWQGLPGDGLGGLNTTATAALFAEPYRISTLAQPSWERRPQIAGVPIQVSGSKSLSATWWGALALDDVGAVTCDRNGLLAGRLINPLDVALSDCLVLHENWAYPISGVLAPGGSVSFDGRSPRNLEWRLTRRRVVETRDVGTPWDQAASDVPRIMEMLMFHEAAGGEAYTGLTHRYQSHVDLSEHLRTGRVILVGRGTSAATRLMRQGRPLDDACDRHWTFYRVIFPIRRT